MEFTQEEAVVDEVKSGFAYLITNNTSCESCTSQAGCSSFSFFPKSTRPTLKVNNTLELVQGDRVIVELKAEKLVLGSFMAYIFPIVCLIFFSIVGKSLFGEGISILFGILGFSISLFLTKYLMGKKNISDQFEPTVLRKIITINSTSK